MSAIVDDCMHEARIDDMITGDEVCTQCGLVLGPAPPVPHQLHHPPNSSSSSSSSGSNIDDCDERRKERKWRLFIEDVCHNANLTPSTAAHSYDLFTKLKTKSGTRGSHLLHLATYALHYTSVLDGVGMSPFEVCHLTGADPKQLCKLHEKFRREDDNNYDEIFSNAKCFLARLCYALDLQFADEMLLRKLMDTIQPELGACRPTTLSAALIYLYVSKRGKCSAGELRKTLKTLGDQTSLSEGSIRRVARTIERTFPNFCMIMNEIKK